MWGKRIVYVQSTKNAMALALYLTSDVRKDKSGDTKIKGVTVNHYEKGMIVYRCSRGLKKPIAYKQGKEIKGELVDKELIHEANYDYTAPNGFHNIVCKNTYQKRYEKLTKRVNVQL